MANTSHPVPAGLDARRSAADKRLEDIGWGLFLLMTGAIWLVPEGRVPPGTWLTGTGLLLLAFNAARYFKGLAIHVLTTVLGILAVAGGLAALGGGKLPLFAICLIVAGAVIILRPLLTPRS